VAAIRDGIAQCLKSCEVTVMVIHDQFPPFLVVLLMKENPIDS
jgi:hypothetical protein